MTWRMVATRGTCRPCAYKPEKPERPYCSIDQPLIGLGFRIGGRGKQGGGPEGGPRRPPPPVPLPAGVEALATALVGMALGTAPSAPAGVSPRGSSQLLSSQLLYAFFAAWKSTDLTSTPRMSASRTGASDAQMAAAVEAGTCRSARRSDASCTDEGGNQHAIRDHQSYLPIGEKERRELH